VREIDPDHDGNLSLDEFLVVMKNMEQHMVDGENILKEQLQ
jgi:Ca2+-binding EF-hand superfamily protein